MQEWWFNLPEQHTINVLRTTDPSWYCCQWFLGRLVWYFDVRLFRPHAPSNRQSSYYHKQEFWRSVHMSRESEKLSMPLAPLVLSATGGMANEATVFYKRLPHAWQWIGTILLLHHVLVTLWPDFLSAPVSHPVHQGCLFYLWPHCQVTTSQLILHAISELSLHLNYIWLTPYLF